MPETERKRSQVQLAIDEAMTLVRGGFSPENASLLVAYQYPALDECGEPQEPFEECLLPRELSTAVYERWEEEMRDGQ